MDNQMYLSQLHTSLCFYKILFEVKKIDVRLNKTFKLKFILMLFDSFYLTCPSNKITKYTIYLLSYCWNDCIASKTWLKNVLYFTFWDRIFTRVFFCKSSFFIPSFWHQDWNNHYLVVATAKIQRNCKRTSLDVYFSMCKSQDCALNVIKCPLNVSELFNRNLSIVHPTHF